MKNHTCFFCENHLRVISNDYNGYKDTIKVKAFIIMEL